jgi:hypothetical protein
MQSIKSTDALPLVTCPKILPQKSHLLCAQKSYLKFNTASAALHWDAICLVNPFDTINKLFSLNSRTENFQESIISNKKILQLQIIYFYDT